MVTLAPLTSLKIATLLYGENECSPALFKKALRKGILEDRYHLAQVMDLLCYPELSDFVVSILQEKVTKLEMHVVLDKYNEYYVNVDSYVPRHNIVLLSLNKEEKEKLIFSIRSGENDIDIITTGNVVKTGEIVASPKVRFITDLIDAFEDRDYATLQCMKIAKE
uniref:Uncharacterized protein n=1 Tax=Pithovirus LCDPAC01 TaxID=2506600 RepID=A0A4D5XEV9_9VIRU|nr:MAG: hypothetical protein LCDPAC01_02580 [Pithovirus LCDPAC01]